MTRKFEKIQEIFLAQQSNSSWAAPIVCARKKNGALRLAIDCRGLNAVSEPATLHPIPRIDDLFACLGDAKKFQCTLDAKSS